MNHAPSQRQILPFLLLIPLTTGIPSASSHRDRMRDIDHLAHIEAASSFVNIEVVLHFHEIPSEQSRRGRMDTDGDGKITTSELDRYCSELDEKLLRRFTFQVDGKPVPLINLYRPEADLLGNNRVQQFPHLLKIFLTASFPSSTTGSSQLRFEDRSFSSIPGQLRMEVRDVRNNIEWVFKTSTNRDITFNLLELHASPENPFHTTSIPTNQEEYREPSSP